MSKVFINFGPGGPKKNKAPVQVRRVEEKAAVITVTVFCAIAVGIYISTVAWALGH